MSTTDQLPVPREARGQRLDRFLVEHVPGLSIDRARQLCDRGLVHIKDKPAQPSRKLWGGELVQFEKPAPQKAANVVDPGGTELPVLFEDAQLAVVNKPAGLVVERYANRPSVVALLASRLSGFDVDGKAEPAVVHRLDRDTSGCLALAKTDAARAALMKAFDAKQVDKRYLALVLGHPPDRAALDTPYGRSRQDPRLFTTRVFSARRARLSFETIERFADTALVAITLDTGRTHQIRVQLAEAGHAVLADPVYGPQQARSHPAAVVLGRHALHAERLALPHPVDGRPLVFEAPLPSDLERAIDSLRRAAS